jgi:uncharacterized membrane-anchored protein
MKSSRIPHASFALRLTRLAFFLLLPCGISPVLAEETGSKSEARNPLADIDWQAGPSTAHLGKLAELQIPEGCMFTGAAGTRRFLEANENPTSGHELGLLVHSEENDAWFATFSFNSIGYVKDDEKDNLDAGAILESIREGTEEANKEREKRGWSSVEVVGWAREPKYNSDTNRLEWAVRGRSQGDESVNFSTRLLGRRGVMMVQLVSSPERMEQSIAEFESVLGGFTFRSGHRYTEFRQGDTIAKYGLSALIAGGLGAAAVKSGLLGKLWKFIALAVIGGLGALKRFFTRKPSSPDVQHG